MKAITYSLLSYFQQHLFANLITILTTIVFVFLNFYLLIKIGKGIDNAHNLWIALLIVSVVMTSIIAVHLKRLIKSSSTILLPDFRKYQVITASLILAVIVVIPAVIVIFHGFPIYISLALLLFATSIATWLFYYFGDNPIVFVGVVWPVRFVYELLGFETRQSFFGSLSDIFFFNNPLLVSIALISLSSWMLYLFARYYLNLSSEKYKYKDFDETDPWARDHDRIDNLTEKLILRYLKKIVNMSKMKTRSLMGLIKMQQIALFSPPSIVSTSLIGFLALIPLIATWIYFRDPITFSEIEGRGIVVIYFILSFFLTTDFLQHRNRLPMLYLQSQVPSRKTFTRTTIGSYLLVFLRRYVSISVFISLVLFLLPTFQVIGLFKVWIIGAIFSITMIAFSLLNSNAIKTAEAKGWIITTIIFFIIIIPITLHNWESLTWLFLGIVSIICLWLFWLAVRRWDKTELDFAGM